MRCRLLLWLSALGTLATHSIALADDAALRQALRAPGRATASIARDTARHPLQELSFFGVGPNSNVVEIWPGRGYWTEILAPLLYASGTYRLALAPADGGAMDRLHAGEETAPIRAKLRSDPTAYSHIILTRLGAGHDVLAPPGTVDAVLTFRNLHDWLNQGDAPEMLSAIHDALKPNGILGIEDHRGSDAQPQDPKAASGYVRQDFAVSLIEHSGFELVGSSEMNANPRDTKDWPAGVWTLPPTLARVAIDRTKYIVIGEADNFVLKFRRVDR